LLFAGLFSIIFSLVRHLAKLAMLSLVRPDSSFSLNGQYLVVIGENRPGLAAILDEIKGIFKGE
jgi:hypothetical protein